MKKKSFDRHRDATAAHRERLAAAEKLYSFAFKRINYVPDASDEMQKYATAYYRHVDWVATHDHLAVWHLDTTDHQHLSALWLAHPNSHKAVIIGHGYKALASR